MPLPWAIQDGWEKDAVKKGFKIGTDQFQQYYASLQASQDNDFKVPTIAGFVILGAFLSLVALEAIRQLVLCALPTIRTRQPAQWISRWTQAPLVGTTHARVLMASTPFSLQTPLRGEASVLLSLVLLNVVALFAFYRPYDPVLNQKYPDGYSQALRSIIDRAAILAVSQIPIIVLLSGHNSVVRFVTRCSLATTMLYHRWVSRVVFVQILLHAIGYSVYGYHVGGKSKYIGYWHKPYFQCGVVAAFAMAILIFLSLRSLRRRSYEAFVSIHVVAAILVLLAIFYHIHLLNTDSHYDVFLGYIYASFAAVLLDKAMRLARVLAYSFGLRYISSGRVTLVGSTGVLKIVVQPRGFGSSRLARLRPGHHVLLWVPSCQFGGHPFTVAEIIPGSKSVPAQFVLYARILSGVTRKMAAQASMRPNGCHLTMYVEAFYGRSEDTSAYSDQVLVAGGIGITHCLPYFVQAAKSGKSCHLIWMLRDLALAEIPVQALQRVLQGEHEKQGDEYSEEGVSHLLMTIVLTKPTKRDEACRGQCADEKSPISEEAPRSSREGEAALAALSALHRRLHVTFLPLQERPKMQDLIRDRLCPEKRRHTLLLSCGPPELCDATRDAARLFRLAYVEQPYGW